MNSKMLDALIALLNKSNEKTLSETEWRDLILVSRASGVLARVAHCLAEDVRSKLNSKIYRHFEAAKRHETLFHNQVKNEIEVIRKGVLNSKSYKVALLKGAGYVFSQSGASKGRIFSDIDILVQKNNLADFEQSLNLLGWVSRSDNYDDTYYRQWAHEIPPMIHINRSSVIDVHHNIVPIVSGRAPNAELLWDETKTIDDGVQVLSTSAMFVHSAIHLFFKEEFYFGFRDLTDLMCLFIEMKNSESDIEKVKTLASKLGFELEVYLALRYLKLILKVDEVDDALQHFVDIQPSKFKLLCYDWMYRRVLIPRHSLTMKKFTGLASSLAFLRGHLLKMPLHIFIKHITVKTLNGMLKKITGNNTGFFKQKVKEQ